MTCNKIIKFQSKKYKFIASFSEADECYFEIYAICKDSGRWSCINTLNTILSEYGIDDDDERIEKSIWALSEKEEDLFIELTKEIAASPSFLNYLDEKLDQDRFYGEWVNMNETIPLEIQ